MRSFYPNCSLPSAPAFVEQPNVRGTMDIVWACLSVIVISVWSVLNLSVPPHIRPQTRMQKLRHALFVTRRKIIWMLILLLVPEVAIICAADNFVQVKYNTAALKRLAEEDGVPWNETHTYLSIMGGIAIRFREASLVNNARGAELAAPNNSAEAKNHGPPAEPGPDPDPEYQLIHSRLPALEQWLIMQSTRYASMGSIEWRPFRRHVTLAEEALNPTLTINDLDQEPSARGLACLAGNIWVVTPRQLQVARNERLIAHLPTIHDDEIADRSKSDGLIRFLAVLQAAWLGVQLILRAARGLPSTLLEISTLAFAVMALILYALQWSKPKDVGVPFYVEADGPGTVDTAIYRDMAVTGTSTAPYWIHNYNSNPNNELGDHRWMTVSDNLSFGLTSLLFGAVHVLAWNFEFPTRIEQVLWRVSAIITTCAPTATLLFTYMMDVVANRITSQRYWFAPWVRHLGGFGFLLLGLAYILSRLFLLVESLRSLYFLPPDAFVSTGANNVPHLG